MHPDQPQPIIIKQETSTGTKVGIWTLVALIGIPLFLVLLCCGWWTFAFGITAANMPNP